MPTASQSGTPHDGSHGDNGRHHRHHRHHRNRDEKLLYIKELILIGEAVLAAVCAFFSYDFAAACLQDFHFASYAVYVCTVLICVLIIAYYRRANRKELVMSAVNALLILLAIPPLILIVKLAAMLFGLYNV